MPADRPAGSASCASCEFADAHTDARGARGGCHHCAPGGPHCTCAHASLETLPVFEHYDRAAEANECSETCIIEPQDAFAADGEQCGVVSLPPLSTLQSTLHTQMALLAATHQAQDEPVTTIYMAGFPEDFREREFHNLFAFAQGYEGCSLKYPSASHECVGDAAKTSGSGQILGFARFRTIPDALEACRVLNGRVLDAERGAMLRVEMAKKNLILGPARSRSTFISFAPAPPTHVPTLSPAMLPSFNVSVASAPAAGSPKRSLSRATPMAEGETTHSAARRSSLSSLPACPEALGNTQVTEVCSHRHSGGGDSPSARETRSLSLCVPGSSQPVPVLAPAAQARRTDALNAIQTNTATVHGEHPPCNTLYVGNLPAGVCELELRALFCATPGYRRLSLKAKLGGSPMCFVEFEDVASATAAMEALYGTALSNSTKGGIRLSYSKNPLGVRPAPFAPLFPSAYTSLRGTRATGSAEFYLDTAPWGGLVTASDSAAPSGSSSVVNDAFFADLFTPLRISPGCERRASAGTAPGAFACMSKGVHIAIDPGAPLHPPDPSLSLSAHSSPGSLVTRNPAAAETSKAAVTEAHTQKTSKRTLSRQEQEGDIDALAFEPDDIGSTTASVAAARVLFASA